VRPTGSVDQLPCRLAHPHQLDLVQPLGFAQPPQIVYVCEWRRSGDTADPQRRSNFDLAATRRPFDGRALDGALSALPLPSAKLGNDHVQQQRGDPRLR
jgi:hypothetical protein